MYDFISKNNSIRKDVSKENIDYLNESQKISSDDVLFTNCNLSNNFDDYSINEMNLPSINLQSIESIKNNFYGLEKLEDDSNNFNQPIKKLLEDNSKKNKKLISRKKENPKNNNNGIKKLKKYLNNSTLNFINDKILKTFNYNIGNGINKKKLYKINSKHFNNFKADFNKELLETTLGEIFSYDISEAITNYLNDFNKKLINKLLNEEDLKKRKIFEDLFSKTFLDCIDQIIGKKRINELQGLERFFENEIKSKVDGEALKELLNNYQEIISSKRPRKSKNVKKKIGDE